MWGGYGMRRGPQAAWEHEYYCNSTAFCGREGIEDGDKMLLPPSALDDLARMQVEYPMLFECTNISTGKKTHCGVLEFTAEEGRCYMPFWIMENLFLEEGGLLRVKNVSLPKATFVKFRPQSVDFLDVSNPRAMLEVALRKYTALTIGDQICIPYSGKKFYLEVCDVQPNGAASVVETDCNVDFEAPVGYVDPKEAAAAAAAAAGATEGGVVKAPPQRAVQKARAVSPGAAAGTVFVPFGGTGHRIDGKQIATPSSGASAPAGMSAREAAAAAAAARFAAGTEKSAASTGLVDPSTTASPTAPTHQSRIGDMFSKKKASVSAFTGPGYKPK